MKRTIDYYEFCQAFSDYDRTDQFTREGLELLFNWLESYEDDTGEEIELDVIAICCEFNEESWCDIIDNYDYPDDDPMTFLEDNTLVVGVTASDTVVYRTF